MILLRRCYRIFTGGAAKPGFGAVPDAGADAADLDGLDILIDGNRIAAIGKNLEAPEGAGELRPVIRAHASIRHWKPDAVRPLDGHHDSWT